MVMFDGPVAVLLAKDLPDCFGWQGCVMWGGSIRGQTGGLDVLELCSPDCLEIYLKRD